jgi:hypothetical protein
MMNQQPLHQEGRQTQECGPLIFSIRTGRAKGFDFHQLEIELVHHGSGLERVIRALGPHASGGNPPQFRVQNLNQPAGSLVVAAAKACHQPGYGIGLKSGWDRHFGYSVYPSREKNAKAVIQSVGLLSHYRIEETIS